MGNQKIVMTGEIYKIKWAAEENNSKFRESKRKFYTRYKREKRNKFWKIYYKIADILGLD